jgi:hypothetical protein
MEAFCSRTSVIVSLSLLLVSSRERSHAVSTDSSQLQPGELIPTGVRITPGDMS